MQEQKVRKIPMRQCLGCNAHKPKKELIRVVRLPDGGVVLDLVGKVSGRGAYICHDKNCFKKARKSGRIAHVLECEIPEDIYDAMEERISGEDSQ
ncbi:MAG: YlxR family protein [Ruminococcaceae bacterium]|nr:YlxR family protein [Oscillospiraceae bacterium]